MKEYIVCGLDEMGDPFMTELLDQFSAYRRAKELNDKGATVGAYNIGEDDNLEEIAIDQTVDEMLGWNEDYGEQE